MYHDQMRRLSYDHGLNGQWLEYLEARDEPASSREPLSQVRQDQAFGTRDILIGLTGGAIFERGQIDVRVQNQVVKMNRYELEALVVQAVHFLAEHPDPASGYIR